MIPPRGCAYICMVHRQDAYRALQKLSTGSFKIGSKIIKVPFIFLIWFVVYSISLMFSLIYSHYWPLVVTAYLLYRWILLRWKKFVCRRLVWPICVLILQIAWALNKGVKQEYKQFWDADLGVTYIPWEKVKLDDLDGFAEGGIIDQETVNDGKNTLFNW